MPAFSQQAEPQPLPVKKPAPAPAAPPPEPAPEHHSSGIGGLFGKVASVASAGLGAVENFGSNVAHNLTGGVNEQNGPALNSTWNHLLGGPGTTGADGRPLTTNHIGTQKPGPVQENGTISNLMRNTPYFGDYWESLSVTHDSRHIQNNLENGATAITDVALPGPLMGLVDAPFRAFGHSLFLDQNSLNPPSK